ncbi:MAG: UDP-N-acetylmuramate dehydrogenase [Acidobacteriia bacterium]|nr:UDP-N-acetylmuramate dehydrogenase [Terriglobia bacterium]
MQIQEHVPLAPLTTFQVGGPARWFVEAASEADVRAAVEHAGARTLPLFVLGGGSNLVVSDAGFSGLVLRIALRGIEEREEGGRPVFDAAAGEDWDAFVARVVSRDCAGIECLSGIPGTVGGTPVQNVGAYGQEVADTITSVRVLDVQGGDVLDLSNADAGFTYRTSIFNSSQRGRYIVLRVSYVLTRGGAPKIEYADLKNFFAGNPSPSLAETREAVRQIRLSKAMLIVPGDDDCRSAGSFFKNPIVNSTEYARIAGIVAGRGLKPPSYPAPDGRVKLAAAWLVEQSGFAKGYTRGAVGISRRHSLAIVNRGGATAAEIIALKNEIQQRVLDTFGIQLLPEPVFVGF